VSDKSNYILPRKTSYKLGVCVIMKLIHSAASKCQCLVSLALRQAHSNKMLLMMASNESRSWALVFLQNWEKPVIVVSLSYCKWNATSLVFLKIGSLTICCKLSTRLAIMYYNLSSSFISIFGLVLTDPKFVGSKPVAPRGRKRELTWMSLCSF
jgi:hypothetical protein